MRSKKKTTSAAGLLQKILNGQIASGEELESALREGKAKPVLIILHKNGTVSSVGDEHPIREIPLSQWEQLKPELVRRFDLVQVNIVGTGVPIASSERDLDLN